MVLRDFHTLLPAQCLRAVKQAIFP